MNVLVLRGGPDSEHDVSLASGSAVVEALQEAGHRVHDEVIHLMTPEHLARLPGEVVFPVLHGPWGEGGGLQIVLEDHGRPFVGAKAAAAALCMDKDLVKRLARASDILTPDWTLIEDDPDAMIDPPVVVKPVDDGSSVGLHLCDTVDAVNAAIAQLRTDGHRIMIERLIEGRELTVGLLHDRALPVVEVSPAGSTYDFAAKYDRHDTQFTVHPQLGPAFEAELTNTARRLSDLCEVRDLARVDFLVDADGTAWLLEINTMPGFTGHSLLPMAAAAADVPMPQLCDGLVQAAHRRGRETSQAHTG